MHPDGILFGGEGRDQITNAGVTRAESRGFVFVSPFCVGGMALRVERFIEGRNGFMLKKIVFPPGWYEHAR
jgi:hypothetical protein